MHANSRHIHIILRRLIKCSTCITTVRASAVYSTELPEFGSGGSGDGDLYRVEFFLRTPGLLLLSASAVLWCTVGRENGCNKHWRVRIYSS